MTQSERNAYHDEYDRWLAGQEVAARRIVRQTFARMNAKLAAQLRSGQTPQQVIARLNVLVSEIDHATILQRIYVSTGTQAASREYTRLVALVEPNTGRKDREPTVSPLMPVTQVVQRPPVSFFSEAWQQRMLSMFRLSSTAERITKMTTSTRILIRDILLRSIDRRWSMPETVKRISGVLGGGKAARNRARLIALTETTRAANAGHEAGAYDSQIRLEKVWIATRDTRTRDTHRAMLSSKPIGPNELFSVGASRMRYPGDPAGGAREVVRCRCVVAYIPKQEEL